MARRWVHRGALCLRRVAPSWDALDSLSSACEWGRADSQGGGGKGERVEEIFVNIETWLGALGAWAYVVAPLVMMVVAILPVPAEAPAMAANPKGAAL